MTGSDHQQVQALRLSLLAGAWCCRCGCAVAGSAIGTTTAGQVIRLSPLAGAPGVVGVDAVAS